VAWWAWAVALAAAAMRTTNPLILGAIVAVTAYVVVARRGTAAWGRAYGSFLRLAAVLVVFRVLFIAVFGVRVPGEVLVTLPSVQLPSWAAGITIGGPVTVELLLGALYDGMRLGTLVVCVGAANALASPYRLLRSLPAALYEAGVVVTVALAFAPQAVVSLGQVRETRRLRGRPDRGLRSVRGLALPVLEGGLERSVALAASMDARGFGRQGALPPAARRLTALATAVGLLAFCVGLYGLLDAGAPRALGLPVLGAGAVLVAGVLFARGRATRRTRYRPDPWLAPEWSTVAGGVAALLAVIVVARLDPGVLAPSVVPLEVPQLPPLVAVGLLAALTPAWLTPAPPDDAAAAVVGSDAAPASEALAA
jgi:energy-coupling factor transport system permease protein